MLRKTATLALLLLIPHAAGLPLMAQDNPSTQPPIANPPATNDAEFSPQAKAWLTMPSSDREAIAKNRPGDRLVVYYFGVRTNAVEWTKEVAADYNLIFEEWNVATPEGRQKFMNRSASDSPEARMTLMQAGVVYIGRGWLLPDNSLAFARVQEYHPLVPIKDAAHVHILATTDPPQGREGLLKKLEAHKLARAAAEKDKATKGSATVIRTSNTTPAAPAPSNAIASSRAPGTNE